MTKKNIYSMLSSFKTHNEQDEENKKDYNSTEEDSFEGESENDLTEITPESLIRILEEKEMFKEQKCKENFKEPKQEITQKDDFLVQLESEKSPEEPKKFPDIAKPEIVKPMVAKPEIVKPMVVKPEIVKPEIVKPEIVKPEIVKPEIVKPDIVKPDIVKPEIVKPEQIKKNNYQSKIQNLLRESITSNPLKKLTNTKKSAMYTNVIKYESVRTRFF